MTALFIILGLVLFFVLLLSVKFRIESEYIDDFSLKIRWSFLELSIYPLDEKISKLLNKPKPEPQEESPAQDENITKKKENPFKNFYNNQGFEGVLELIKNGADALGSMMKSLKKHFIIDDLYLNMIISKNHDAAGTALEYGNICRQVFPSIGYICSTFKVKNYGVNIEPDYIGTLSSAKFIFNCSFRPLFLINAGIVLVFRLLFNVVFKVLFSKPNKSNENKDSQNIKGGATQ